ncbi:MAG: diacylglycerol kinase family protein [Erysipelotrichaceae bacterium]|nr:diacylglycerol kinase family protein [Erysipelotrichaceae bacterium]
MKKFTDAFNGLKEVLKDRSVQTQCILGVMAVIGGIIIRLDEYEWLAFVICIGLVISLEIINSAFERLCDLYTDGYDEKVKSIKDIASACVLVAALAALAVCVIAVLRRIV